MGNSPTIWFQTEQVRAMINSLRGCYNVFQPLSEFELYLIGVENKKKIVASLYRILWSADPVKGKAKSCLEHDLGIVLTEIQWHRIHEFNQLFSANMAIKENRFQLINRWYVTPNKLARIYHQLRNPYWKSGQEEADYYHMWWACPKVFAFWKTIGQVLSQITGDRIPVNPRLMLLLDIEHF